MLEFIPDHTPTDLDDFTRGYLECAEWLAQSSEDPESGEPTDNERNNCCDFHPNAIKAAEIDCADFQAANAADLKTYQEVTGCGLSSAGHDFWLTRNHHGAGFWDRGKHPCLDRLTEASHAYGETDCIYDHAEDGTIWLFIE